MGVLKHNIPRILDLKKGTLTDKLEAFLRLILAKGGNFDLQDTNGCTVTHIMVVFDNINVGITFVKKRTEYFYLDV